MRPLLRYAALYALVELTAVALLLWAFGLGWTLLLAAAAFMAGVLLSASQMKGQIGALRRGRTDPRAAVADGVLVGVGSFLVFLPGIVSTAAGALMLAPPTRTAMRPIAQTMLARGVVRRIDIDRYYTAGPGDYIDGEVIGEVAGQLPARR